MLRHLLLPSPPPHCRWIPNLVHFNCRDGLSVLMPHVLQPHTGWPCLIHNLFWWIYLQTSVEPGGQITVRLAAINPTDNFRGFLIHATSPASPSFVALGSFINPPPNTKSLTCSPGFQVYSFFLVFMTGISVCLSIEFPYSWGWQRKDHFGHHLAGPNRFPRRSPVQVCLMTSII